MQHIAELPLHRDRPKTAKPSREVSRRRLPAPRTSPCFNAGSSLSR